MKSNFLYRLLRPFFVLYLKIRYNPIVIGKENIPDGGCILVGNHKNNLDFICIGITTKRSIHFLAKSSLFKGLLKIILNLSGIIPVDRSKKDSSVLPKCNKLLLDNKVIGIFPERTFNKTDNPISHFKIGAVKMAYDTSKPIIPIMIDEYKKNMKIIIGKKIFINNNDLSNENKKLMKTLEEMIVSNRE